MNFMTKDVGIDLGTSNILVTLKGKGLVLSEPSVVAINKITGEILAVGNAAKEMLGRTPDNIIAVKPLKDGVIADFGAARMLVQTFVEKVVPRSIFSKPRVVIAIPCGITDVEERAVESVGYKAGTKDVYLIEEVMVAAIGAGLKVDRPEGVMIIDIGGGTSEVAVLSLGGIVVENSIKVAGNRLDQDIVEYVKKKFNVLLGEREAEEVKKQIGAATLSMADEKMNVKGRSLSNGLPETITLTTADVRDAISDSLQKIVNLIKQTLEETPPELAADIMEHGIYVCGGCSQIKNFDRFILEQTGIPTFIAEDPTNCVIKGIGATLESIQVLKKSIKTKRK